MLDNYVMWEKHLQSMYQQWQQGNDDYLYRYMDFAKMAAMHHNTSADAILVELQKYNWFILPNQDGQFNNNFCVNIVI